MSIVDENTCAGNVFQGQQWFDLWANNACLNVFRGILFNNQGTEQYNIANLPRVSGDMTDVFNNYQKTNVITIPGQLGYNPFQETIQAACQALPSACDFYLKGATGTNGFCTPYNRDQISSNSALLDFCGCFSSQGLPGAYGPLPTQCDPLCSRIDTIPLFDTAGNQLQCTETTCVIDDVSIQATQTSIGGSVSFTQVCNNCEPNNCKCIIAGVNIQSVIDSVGLGTDLTQLCPQNSCFTVDETTQVLTPVPCADSNTDGSGIAFPVATVLILLLLFAIVGAIILAASNSK